MKQRKVWVCVSNIMLNPNRGNSTPLALIYSITFFFALLLVPLFGALPAVTHMIALRVSGQTCVR